MKVISAALFVLGSGIGVDAAKNPHGFDPAFLKAMTTGTKNSPFLKDVTTHERKAFWRNLLKKAKPASEYKGLRAESGARKLEDNNNYANYANANNGYNYQNGQGDQDQGQQQGYNGQAQQYQYQGNYQYGNNNANYNYNGNGQNMNAEAYYDAAYYEGQNEVDAYGVDWSNLGFDMKQYSLKYTGCSAVKTFDSEKAASGYDSVLSTKRFALFRLCPSNSCNQYSVNGCGRNYGEYVLEMDSFLEGVVEFNRQRYWHYCHFCRRCNGLESYGERMSELSEAEMEYFEQMQADAAEYYENQQNQYQQENEDYANENAANYDYNNYQKQNNNANGNGQNDDNGNGNNNAQYNGDENVDGNQNGGYYNNAYGNNGQNYNGGRKVRKLKYPKTKKQLAGLRKLAEQQQQEYDNENYQQAQQAYYQNQKQQQYENGEIDEEEYQQYMENMQNMNNNMYNTFYWDESVYGEWDQDWSETWLAFNWQVLPYCSESELMACQNADEMCQGYDEDFEQDADAMGGFSACTQIDDNLYIGPHCNNDGYTITLGVYKDQYCDEYIGNEVSLYDVLGYDISDDFDFFPQECVTCEEGGEEREFVSFMEANQDFDNYEEWLDTKWQEYVEMTEQMYEENNGEAQNQYYQAAAAYYNAQQYQDGNQEGYYYRNGNKYQNGGGAYYYGNQQQQQQGQQYAKYGGNYYQNQQMAEQYGNYGAMMVNQGMSFYYNRAQAGDWITNERYDADEWQQQQAEDYGEYYWYRQSQMSFAKSGIADVCGALYTYAAKCNKHLTGSSSSSLFQYSFGSSNQESNEETVCNFIDNLQTQKYDEYGDVVLDRSQLSNGKYVIDFAKVNWRDPDQVKAQAQKTGVTPGQAVGLAITIAACMVMAVWACCLHSTLARKNIPWRPKRGKLTEPTDISRQSSGIVMGRSRSNMSTNANSKAAPLI